MASAASSRAPSANRPLSGRTQVQIHQPNPPTQTQTQPVLHLRGAEESTQEREQSATRRRIQWAEDVVDNEGMGKKTSKGLYFSLFYVKYRGPFSFGTEESCKD